MPQKMEPELAKLMLANGKNDLPEAARQWLTTTTAQIRAAAKAAEALIKSATELADTCELWFESTDMTFLYDKEKKVFRIGYDVDQGKLDENAYDLLASEARLASFLAIAKGEVAADHWIHLGRPLTLENGQALLLSWSGTMFEYLMPQLMMREPATTLLGQSGRIAIDHQIRYASNHDRPWGISESGYSLLDGAQNYAYHAFGAPELSLRSNKGAEDWVITPYATFLALYWRPQAAFDNLKRLEKIGMLGRYGFFEALDFTERRMEVGSTYSIVRSYMAHHHGMSLISLGIALDSKNAVSRFSSDPRVQASELFLQERISLDVEVEYPTYTEEQAPPSGGQQAAPVTPWDVPLDSPTPQVHLLSNGRLSVLASSWGAGGTNWKSDAITRWRPDATEQRWGNWIYVQDRDSRDLWSIARAPMSRRGVREYVRFFSHCVEYKRQDQNLVQTLEVTVSPWHDVELRRISLTNHGDKPRNLRLTSYAEMVLADPRADSQHPAFGNLFVHSEFLADQALLIFERRTRDSGAQAPVVGECLIGLSGVITPTAIETDRAKFIGRGGSYAHPTALESSEGLSGSLGYTLDPVAALQTDVILEPGASVQLAFLRFVGDSREDVLASAARFAFWPRVQRTFEEGESQACQDLWRNQLSSDEFRKVIALTSALIWSPPKLRAPVAVLSANRLQQANLWGVGISGDFPIILVKVGREADVDTAHLLLKAHTFWRRRNFKVDLVLLNIGDSGYEGTTQDTIRRLLAHHNVEPFVGGRGAIFPLTADSLGTEEVVLLETASKLVLNASGSSLAHALQLLEQRESPLPKLHVRPSSTMPFEDYKLAPIGDLRCFNGHGGFSEDGQEYVINVSHSSPTPAPWINVIANPVFGTIVSESGGGYSWFQNSGENRLTSWRNDPVLDEPSECLYLRDEETGALWSATAKPVPHESEYRTRHGAGYSCFEHVRHDVQSEMTVFVPPEDPVKVVRLVLRNRSSRIRRVTLTYYAEWILGTRREDTSAYLQPAFLPEQRALITANPYNPDWPDQIAFLATDHAVHGYTTDRTEFIGRPGSLANPAALKRVGLNNRVEPGRDPCAALQIHVELPANGEHTAVFFLGAGQNFESAVDLLNRYQQPAMFDTAWQASQSYWRETLDAVTLDSPDESVDFIFNQWLVYQTLACRLFGRSGLYQSSGAFGFRDQLQDSMALLHTRPEVCRNQILASAARQFPEGDVLHWWHPPHARGVRTRISDDLVWLPLVVSEYLELTGDVEVLDEQVPWLSGEPLADDEAERYAHFDVSDDKASVYDHCLRVLDRANRLGPHGIPLIGGGDWNDGMNRVGLGGQGESVWMGWFLIMTLQRFSHVATARGDQATAEKLGIRADNLAVKLHQSAWDGSWYRRAYYDDGTPMGSAGQPACEIDSIPQSWAVLSGAADTDRTTTAMNAVWKKLVRPDPGQVLLFTPAFRGRGEGQPDPGYIAAYPPGVRENGGQYTHAACWAGMAFAAMGDATRASAVLDCLNPVKHGNSEKRIAQYQVEPYVLAADIYGEPPHIGRGGWTWYTGSAGWLYRFILESVLGIRRVGNQLQIKPCLPPHWPGYTLRYRYGQTIYRITVKRESEASSVAKEPSCLVLTDDGKTHDITIEI
ncbi:GH36-type glycosyl hydrolase domain-containing protein [Marinobacter sediminum]|uniref:GH36-type glycosyl hydrolase domain-containing protein n=1 Tax=Marinobacter sediminum TaxID=256323 RepID=UPI00356B3337